MAWHAVARASEIPAGGARTFEVEGTSVTVFNSEAGFHACRSSCPHRGGPIGDGSLDGFLVVCPRHGWAFDVRTGVNPRMPAARLETYPLRREGDRLLVDLPEASPERP